MMRSLLSFHLAFLLLLAFAGGVAQAQSVWHVGVRAGYDRVWHETEQHVRALEGECGAFRSGRGSGPSAALVGEVELLPWLRGSARVGFARLGGELRTTCDNGIIVPTGDNQFELLVREYRKDVTMDYALFELGTKIYPLDIPLFFSSALSVGLPLFGAAWEQDETIISPEGVLFPGNTATRSNGAADFTDTQLRSALVAGVGYTLPLRGGLEFSPEIRYSHPFSDATTGYDWKIAYLSAGASLTWRIESKEEPLPLPVKPPPPPPPTPEPEPPTAHIGTTTDAEIDITETFVTETFPLLPYLFFEQNSTRLPDKYRTMRPDGTASFTETALPRKTLAIYYHLLDIVGRRLRLDTTITITLLGSTDDKGEEKGNSTLANGRAEEIKSYFTDVWNIEGRRVSVRTQALPQMPSSREYPEGDEENRRVEIISDSDALFRPVVHERLSEFDITPPTLELALGAESTRRLESWSMKVMHEGMVVAQFGAAGEPPATVRWKLDDIVAARVRAEDALTATLTVTDEDGRAATSELSIPVHKQQNSFEVGRLSLIVFDFDRSDIFPHNRRMIRRFVAEAIKATSSVEITGSTDRLGEADHNLELSTARARNVEEILLSQNPHYEKLDTRGIGEAPELYDNSLPEGRFYCRTVAVEVKTPVE